MTEELIQLPNVEEIKEMLDLAKRDIANEVEQDPELKPASELLTKVIEIVEGKISKTSFEKLSNSDKIDLAAHLHFLQSLLEDFFMFDDFDGEDYEDDEDFEEEEEEK